MSIAYRQDENGLLHDDGPQFGTILPEPRRGIRVATIGHTGPGLLAALSAIGAGMGINVGGFMPRIPEKRLEPPKAVQVEIISAAEKKRLKRAAKRLKAMGNR
jgi:hypothetical protein